jgi:hypothetical protein
VLNCTGPEDGSAAQGHHKRAQHRTISKGSSFGSVRQGKRHDSANPDDNKQCCLEQEANGMYIVRMPTFGTAWQLLPDFSGP